MPLQPRYRIRERRRMTVQVDDPAAEFGPVNQVERSFQVERIGLVPVVEREFRSMRSAMRYAKKNGIITEL